MPCKQHQLWRNQHRSTDFPGRLAQGDRGASHSHPREEREREEEKREKGFVVDSME